MMGGKRKALKEKRCEKKTAAVFLVLAIRMFLFCTFQNPEQSRNLSEAVRSWLGSIGIEVEYKSLRSNVHILKCLIVGLTMCGFEGAGVGRYRLEQLLAAASVWLTNA